MKKIRPRTIMVTCSDSRLHGAPFSVLKESRKTKYLKMMKEPHIIARPGPDNPARTKSLIEDVGAYAALGPIEVFVIVHDDCREHPCSSLQHERDGDILANAIRTLFPGTPVTLGIARITGKDGKWKLVALTGALVHKRAA